MCTDNSLLMVWPHHRLTAPPAFRVSADYTLRTYRPGDEPAFLALMERTGGAGWDEGQLRAWMQKVIPEGWFFAIHNESGAAAATVMAMHNPYGNRPFGGEVGWLAIDPDHSRRSLGLAVATAGVSRLIAGGYTDIQACADDFQLAALKIALKLGFIPCITNEKTHERWQALCQQLAWRFAPEVWKAAL